MEVMRILHMNGGDGEISYARNSTAQRKSLSIITPIIEEAVVELLGSNDMGIESMGIADLGCSSGPNSLLLISQIMDVLHAKLSKVTELRVSLNDLVSNDFNSIFMSLPAFYNKLKQDYNNSRVPDQHIVPFISAVPGSFYGPLFPKNSMHFVHSSFSLHWLSQVPDGLNNKGKIYISKSSPQCVLDAYSMQFQRDFSVFLRSRAQEMVDGGRMVLSFMGRRFSDPTADQSTYHLELLAQALMAMVSNGLIEEEKVDTFNMPYYASCAEELNLVIQKEGSFIIKDCIDTFEVDWDSSEAYLDQNMTSNGAFGDDQTITISGQRVAKSIRAVTEPMLEYHFGKGIMDIVFQKYAELVSRHLTNSRAKYTVLVISLVKKE